MPLEFMLCSSQNLPGLHWKTHLILQFLCGFLEITIPIISLCSHRFALCWLYPISLFQTSCSVFAFVFPICLCLCISNFIYDVCSKLALSHFPFPNKLLCLCLCLSHLSLSLYFQFDTWCLLYVGFIPFPFSKQVAFWVLQLLLLSLLNAPNILRLFSI